MRELAPQQALSAALGAVPEDLLSGPVGVAVSGGSDSVALLHLAAGWAAERKTKLLVLTVDHGLRPESAAEAGRVADIARALGYAHRTLRWTSPQPRQSAARRARHQLLAATLRDAGGCLLLTGHTADDQAETLLIRARQGSGWYGLAGMRALSLSPVWPEGAGVWIARPLLQARRAALRHWLEGEGTRWIEDPSNVNPVFERVRVRALLAARPGLTERVLGIQARLAVLRTLEDSALGAWLGQAVETSGDHVSARLDVLPPERAARALGVLIQCVSGRDTPPRSEALAALAGRLARPESFRGATLGGVQLRLRKGRIMLSPEAAKTAQAPSIGEIRARIASFRRLFINSAQDIAAGSGKESFLRDLAPILPEAVLSLCETSHERS